MSLKEHGSARYGRIISRNVQQARYLAERIQASSNFELLAPAPLNVVCFRFVHADRSEAALDDLNENLLASLQESGVAVLSSTRIRGCFALRAAITNHRTRRDDFDVLLRTLDDLGQRSIAMQANDGERSGG